MGKFQVVSLVVVIKRSKGQKAQPCWLKERPSVQQLPVDLLHNLVDSCLLWSEAAVDRPTASDIASVPMPFTASVHQQQLPVLEDLHMSAMHHISCVLKQ